MQIEILAIGDELLEGSVINTNAAYISSVLGKAGYTCSFQQVIGDHLHKGIAWIQAAFSRADLVFLTGGLGPTQDDLTRAMLAEIFSIEPLLYKNPAGVEPAQVYTQNGKMLIALPGVPKELYALFPGEILPKVEAFFPKEHVLSTKELCIGGKKEVDVDAYVRKLSRTYPSVKIGIYPSLGTLRLLFSTKDSADTLDAFVLAVESAYFSYVFSHKGESIQEAFHAVCREKQLTIAFAESCTGGALGAAITELPGASSYFLGSIVAYSEDMKKRYLDVSKKTLFHQGAVSIETVEEMATSLKNNSSADYVAAVSGMLGSLKEEAQSTISAGKVAICIHSPKQLFSGWIQAPKNRNSGIEYTVHFVLFSLWRLITQGKPPEFHGI